MSSTLTSRRDHLDDIDRPIDEQVNDEPINVVLVDDDADFLEITEMYLIRERPAFEIHSFTTVPDAIEFLENESDIDAVVSDYLLPGTNGLEFLKHVRKDHPELPFLLFTGAGSEQIASRAIKEGVTDYLKKDTDPSQFSVLANRLHNAVKRYRTQSALATAGKRYAKLVENSSDVICVVDETGEGTFLSPSAKHVLGYEPGELIGDNAFEYIHPDDQEYAMLTFYHLLEHPEKQAKIEYRFKDPDREWPVLEARAKNLLDDEVVQGFVVNTRDVTKSVAREAELRHQRNQLENLRKSLTHDLKSPLTVAFSTLTLFRETGDEEHVKQINQSLKRINQILDQMAELSEYDESISETAKVKLETVLSAAWEMVDTANAQLQIVDSKVFEADPGWMQQLFENLIRNAIDHGGQDVTITVSIENDAIIFEDDGPGIDRDDRSKVFEPGYATGNGLGYGLVIVKQIVLGHGWDISIEDGGEGGARLVIEGIEFAPHSYT